MLAVRTPLAGIGFAFVVLLAEAFVGRAFLREAQVVEAQETEQVDAERSTRCDAYLPRETRIAPVLELPVIDLSAWNTQTSRHYTLEDL